jgi:hypothetical protein
LARGQVSAEDKVQQQAKPKYLQAPSLHDVTPLASQNQQRLMDSQIQGSQLHASGFRPPDYRSAHSK